MSKHQIIYTSCMRGIDGVNDGQQIYSYDEAFKELKTDEVKSLFTYQVPALPSGVLMSEEIAKTMPAAFSYRLLKNGCPSITLNTYLGRDYMGSAGRFGNHLSHSVICDFDELDMYPCELYGSDTLRSSMEYEEVNNPNPPDYLPVPELDKGYVLDADSVIEFLGENDNLEKYRKMAAAMLSFQAEKKRIVICDEPGNIARWIAALHYTMPLDIAKKINFTTYEYDPELSSAQICGVVPDGSRYNCDSYIMSGRHYVFDFINGKSTPVEAQQPLMDFLDTAFSFSYKSLTDFHDFIINATTYRECNEKYYTAYDLYCLLSDGIADLSYSQFEKITAFADEYVNIEGKKKLICKLAEDKENIERLDIGFAMYVMQYMFKHSDILSETERGEVKQIVTGFLIMSLHGGNITEQELLSLYNNINNMAHQIGLSIPAELMVDLNRELLLGVLADDTNLWKIHFIVRIISDYVKDTGLPVEELYPDRAIGGIYYGIIKLAYENNRNDGLETVRAILEHFKGNIDFYMDMALNIEGVLRDIGLDETEIGRLWKHVCSVVGKTDNRTVERANNKLAEYERFDEMYLLFGDRIHNIADFSKVHDYFIAYWNNQFKKNAEYGRLYAAKALKEYEGIYREKSNKIPADEQLAYACEIADIAIKMKVTDAYVSKLCNAIIGKLPLTKPDADNKALLEEYYRYKVDILGEKIGGRLLLFVIALELNEIKKRKDIEAVLQKLQDEEDGHSAVLSGLSDTVLRNYFEWAFSSLSEYSLTSDEYKAVYNLYSFTREAQTAFMEYWFRISYKSVREESYAGFAEYLKFLSETGSTDGEKLAGKALCKLNKQKLAELDSKLRPLLGEDKKYIKAWDNVKDIASSTNPLLNNLSNLFRRK